MKLSVIATALALSLPLTAFANVTSTAQAGNFRFEVIDLDLNDGIAAALTLDEGGKVLVAGYYDQFGVPGPFEYLSEDGSVTATFGAGSSTAALANGQANAAATATGTDGELFGTVAVGYSYTLTANTQVILYVDASVAGGVGSTEPLGSSHASLFSYTYDSSKEEPTEVEDYLESHLGNVLQRQLSLTFSSGNNELQGELGYAAGAYAGISAVPEPSQVALLTLGLAGLAWRSRRTNAGGR